MVGAVMLGMHLNAGMFDYTVTLCFAEFISPLLVDFAAELFNQCLKWALWYSSVAMKEKKTKD